MSRKKINILFSSLVTISITLAPLFVKGQYLCENPPGSEKGDFDLEEFTFCAPKTVIVKDKSGGENIRYNFIYQGEPASALNPNIPFLDRFRYAGYVQPTVFTILQYGTKNGKPMYACKNHVVRQSNRAKYSFNPCSNSSLSIAIPKDSLINDYDYYEISTDKFRTILATVQSTDLPFENIFNIGLPQRIYVRGMYNDDSKNCTRDVASDFVPNPNFVPTTGLDLPHFANIDAILLNDNGMEMDLRGSLVGSTYSLYRRDIDGEYTDSPLKEGLEPGRNIIEFDNADQQSCFFVKKEQNSCRTEESAEICTVNIKEIEQLSGKQLIKLSPYPQTYSGKDNNPTGENKVSIISNTYSITVDGTLKNTGSFGKNISQIENIISGCEKTYCYQIETTVQGTNNDINFTSFIRSNIKCYDPKEIEIPSNFLIATTLDDDNLANVFVAETVRPVNPITSYTLYYEQDGVYVPYDSINLPAKSFKTTLNGSENNHCFKVKSKNECGSESKLTDSICTIYLKFEDNKTLAWTSESPFAGEVNLYKVLTKNTDGTLTRSFYELDNQTFEYVPNLNLFEDEATFRIEATGEDGISLSNIVVKELAPKIFLPLAFSPNGDGINDSYTYIGNRARIKSVDFRVLDRVGRAVYTTTDVNFEWKPTTEDATIGTYFYRLNIVLDNGEQINATGDIQLLK